MSTISYSKYRISTFPDEPVLQALIRHGINVRSSCRGGACQTCMMRSLSSDIPKDAQSNLNPELIAKNYFLPCVCIPSGDMVIVDSVADDFFVPTRLHQRREEDNGITYVLEPPGGLSASISTVIVRNQEGHKKYFELANHPNADYYFEIFVPGADTSQFALHLRNSLHIGMYIEMREALSVERTDDTKPEQTHQNPNDPPPDLKLWAAFGNGELLRTILKEFYSRVYSEPKLSPYFSGFTQQRLVEKQYSFLQQAITGDKVYFGNRPRNAHHWMVITDDIFELREKLMIDCMRTHGLDNKWIDRWLKLEDFYRKDIVKSKPFSRQFNGIDLPLEGFEKIIIEIGSICDGCGGVIEIGESVSYHLRLGTVFCARCFSGNEPPV